MDNTCVVGYGVVGQATAKLFGIKKYFDLKESTITLEQAAKSKYCFICLPTPVDNEGNYVTTDISEIIKQIEGYGGAGIYIIRSTVWPGFANHIMDNFGIDRMVSNPEFLSENTAERDTKAPPFILLGGNPRFVEEVKALYQGRVKGAEFIVTDNITAEMSKLALNAYFSTKVIFANQLYDVCRSQKINYEKIREVLEKHPFGPKNHFATYYKGQRGVRGKCLPKDLKAFNRYTDMELTKLVDQINTELISRRES